MFSGQVTPDQYNAAWWKLRERYQGVAPPSPRGEEFFDPGAKYHVPANTPYARYFLASVLQFQFHRALAKVAGCTTPLHRCSIYGNAAAGERLRKTLAMGASRPWPDALEALTGQRQMDATAMADYFAPLKAWLDEQNSGRTQAGDDERLTDRLKTWIQLQEVLLPFLVRCGAAALCGAMIGLERELGASRPASAPTS